MKRLATMLTAALLASACSNSKTTATLDYVQLLREPNVFVVEFDSDIDLDALHAKNTNQKVVAKNLICALGSDQNFDVDHKMQEYFLGSVQRQESVGQARYRYRSRGNFYHDTPGSTDMKFLAGAALEAVLGAKKSVACKVVMTVYMASPYYSNSMEIPAQHIAQIAAQAQ